MTCVVGTALNSAIFASISFFFQKKKFLVLDRFLFLLALVLCLLNRLLELLYLLCFFFVFGNVNEKPSTVSPILL